MELGTILDRASGRRFVLLGEATHGTHEFYALRAELTMRLVEEHGFAAVAAEADWPDAYRVNCFVRGIGDDSSAEEALGDFRRFPAWMWRNTVIEELLERLRALGRRVGFYGLDLYSLHASMEAVVRYLEDVDPEAARRARERFGCFERFRAEGDGQAYGYAAELGRAEPCEDEVVTQLLELRSQAAFGDADERHFAAEQNARAVVGAEAYYRSMFRGRATSWNLRDRHMADTLAAVAEHVGGPVVVWAHNSHVGDARATEMSRWGELNLGQLVRERHPGETFIVGFSTYAGRSPPRPAGAGRPSGSASGPAFPEAGRSGCTSWATAWCSRTSRSSENRGSSGPSASSTSRRRSARATTSMPAPPTSSTPSSTSTRRVRSSRSSGRANGWRASCPRRTRLPSKR